MAGVPLRRPGMGTEWQPGGKTMRGLSPFIRRQARPPRTSARCPSTPRRNPLRRGQKHRGNPLGFPNESRHARFCRAASAPPSNRSFTAASLDLTVAGPSRDVLPAPLRVAARPGTRGFRTPAARRPEDPPPATRLPRTVCGHRAAPRPRWYPAGRRPRGIALATSRRNGRASRVRPSAGRRPGANRRQAGPCCR